MIINYETLTGGQLFLQELPKLIRPLTEQFIVSHTKITHVIDKGESASTYAMVRLLSE